MKQTLFVILSISLISCSVSQQRETPRSTSNVANPRVTPPESALIEDDEEMNGLLPYSHETKSSSKESRDFNELHRLIPISFGADRPEGEELQRCIELTLIYVVENDGSTRVSVYVFFVSFEDATSARIDDQTRIELRRFDSLLDRRPLSLIELRVPEGVVNQTLARRRIQLVKGALIMAGVSRDRIIEGQDRPPE
ncbi:MAG: hypothetical protein U9P90_03880 [Patescibacteria group bacterium]|nr:hypothetical protein [Patescibacteria group bacterium]